MSNLQSPDEKTDNSSHINSQKSAPKPPLTGLRVLDMSRVLAGPWATQLLADLGAEVLKIEHPDRGDDTRHWGPPFLKDKQGSDTDIAAYYLAANRGKKSIAIDFTISDGQKILQDLAAKSDIVIENFKCGGLRKYGLDYESLKGRNPELIYCSITGFGQTGPYASRPGYDALIQGMGGLMSITGTEKEPAKVGVAVTDIMTGMYAVSAILAALHARRRDGIGQYIDMALLDVQAAMLANQNMYYLTTGQNPPRLGTAHPTIVPYQAFACADGFLILAVGNDRQFASFCAVAGINHLAQDKRFHTNDARVRNRDQLIQKLEPVMKTLSMKEWVRALEDANVPCGPINPLSEVYADQQIQHRGLQITASHPRAGDMAMIGCPIKFGSTPLAEPTAPPELGADTEAVLCDILNINQDDLHKLRAKRA